VQDQQRRRADPVGGGGAGDAHQLATELQGRRQGHGARQVARRHRRQQRVARRHGEGADRAGGQAVGDQQGITEAAQRQHAGQDHRRDRVEHVVAQQQLARIAAIGGQASQRQEQQRRRHQGHLRHADGEGVHVQDHRDQPREEHHLDAQRHEPGPKAGQVGGKAGGTRCHGRSLACAEGELYLVAT